MPVDTRSLVALIDLAAQHRSGGPRRSPSTALGPAVRSAGARRVAVLATASVVAGLVAGLVVPVEGVAAAATSSASSARRSTFVVPAVLPGADASPFAAVAARPAPLATSRVATPASPAPASNAAPASSSPVLTTPLVVADPGAPRAGSATDLRPVAVALGVPGAAPAYAPTRPLPSGSGTGRRIVYAERAAHLWVVDADGQVIRDYAVTGRVGRPRPGVYHVYSKSPVATNPGEKLRFEYMVRFAYGLTGARIGFHTIPRYNDGVPIQQESQLGRAIGAGGCVRQTRADAQWLYAWARVGDTVVVRL